MHRLSASVVTTLRASGARRCLAGGCGSTRTAVHKSHSFQACAFTTTRATAAGSSATAERILVENPGSLIPETLKEMETDADFRALSQELKTLGVKKMAQRERKQRRQALDKLGVPTFREFLHQQGLPHPRKQPVEMLQLNMGLTCNQACTHCHVESTPFRKETMDRRTADKILEVLRASPTVTEVDITGGAPELHEQFRYLVREIRAMNISVIDRCNLTVLYEPGQEDLPEFLAEQGVRIVASLPCYSQGNVNKQRGKGVFQRSIQALLDLNAVGFGKEGSGLSLDLVYNPGGAFLPPAQAELELAYKAELAEHFGIAFNNLFTMTNMPVKRFADFLYRRKQLPDYMKLLVDNFNEAALPNTVCQNLVSVRWDGLLHDCDFNLALQTPMTTVSGDNTNAPNSIHDIKSLDEVVGRTAASGSHCFGCTAGQGSS